MKDFVRLHAAERVPGRQFTDPEHSRSDLAALDYMRDSLREILKVESGPQALRPDVPGGRGQNVTVAQRAVLVSKKRLTVVGFFGQRRSGVDLTPLYEIDQALVRQFDEYPGVLSYSRLELEDGNWGNLVILGDVEAGTHWQGNELHSYAVRQLAPRCYHSVRLHNALLPEGVFGRAGIHLIRTRYFDYTAALPWLAVRADS